MSEQQRYLNQIEQFYNGRLKAHQVIKIGHTPDYLIKLGAKSLPIVMKQSTLAKCIRKPKGSKSAHNLSRAMIETLPVQILNPVFVINERQRNSFAIITDYKDQNENHMLIALKLESNVQNIAVNEIVSFYGRNNLKIYLEKQNEADIHILNSEKAKSLASLLRLQLPTTLQEFDSKNKIPSLKESVNKKISIHDKLEQYQKEVHNRDATDLQRQKEQQQRER